MSYHAELLLTTETLDRLVVQEFHWGLVQLTTERNVPLGGVLTGQIRLVLDRLHHPVLAAWMADSYKKLSGKVVAYGLDGISVARVIEFEDGACFNQGMYFDATKSGFSTGLSLLISAQTLRIDGVAVLTNASQY